MVGVRKQFLHLVWYDYVVLKMNVCFSHDANLAHHQQFNSIIAIHRHKNVTHVYYYAHTYILHITRISMKAHYSKFYAMLLLFKPELYADKTLSGTILSNCMVLLINLVDTPFSVLHHPRAFTSSDSIFSANNRKKCYLENLIKMLHAEDGMQ